MAEGIFTVGFARCDITPQEPNLPLAGYGAVDLRRSTEVIDPLSAQLLCLGEDGKPTLMLVTCDLISADAMVTENIRARVSKATGIPEAQIMVGGTHSHSTPATYSKSEETLRYLEYLFS